MTGDSEVAVRENGAVTAVSSPSLDKPISVDLDHDPPLIGVPENTAVVFEDDAPPHDRGDEEPHVETDGGLVRDHVVSHRQLGVDGDALIAASVVTVLAFIASGYLGGHGETISAAVVGAAGVMGLWFTFFREASDD